MKLFVVCVTTLALLIAHTEALSLASGLERTAIKKQLTEECSSFSQISNADPAKIQDLAAKLEAVCPVEAPAALENVHMMNGKWETLYTSLPMPKIDSLKALTYNALPFPQDPENTLALDVGCFYQLVNTETNAYSNFVDFKTQSGGNEIDVVLSTLGTYSLCSPEDDAAHKRLMISFTDIFVNPVPNGFRTASEADLIIPKAGDDIAALRAAFGLKEEQALANKFPPNYKSSSDITYVDEDFRLMRGQTGTLYILKKV